MGISNDRFGEFQESVAAGACVAPSLLWNVVPHIEKFIRSGFLSTSAAGMAIVQGVSVMLLAAIPFRMARTNFLGKAALGLFAVVLILFNLMNLLDVAHVVRDSETERARVTLAKAAALKSRISELEKSRREVPAFSATSEEQVEAARKAAASAERARDIECNPVAGPLCRQRMDAVATVQSSLLVLSRQRTYTARAEELDREIARKKQDLSDLGPLPEHVDATSDSIAEVAGLFFATGKGAEKKIAKWRPFILALVAEAFTLFGPWIVRRRMVPTADTSAGTSQTAKVPVLAVAKAPRKAPAQVATEPPVEVPLLPSPEKARKPAKTAGTTQEDIETVRRWMEARTAPRRGGEVQVADCYASYTAWCGEEQIAAVSLTRFGTIMTKSLKVKREEKRGRRFYMGIVLKGASLRVVEGSKVASV